LRAVNERVVVRVGAGAATLRGRQLGARLQRLRGAAGLTGEEVARRMARAHSTVSRWETGSLVPRPPDVSFMLELYGVDGTQRDALLRDARQARNREDGEFDISVAGADYAWMEGRAWRVEAFQDGVIPGLLQTPDYAREVLRAWDPGATSRWIERALAARIARQRRLTDDAPLQLAATLGEGTLRHLVGGPQVMRAQLRHLVDVAAEPNIALRVLPFATGAHAGMSGPFTILRFRDEPDVAAVESCGGDMYLEDVEPFAQALRRLTAAALPQRKSAAMIAAMRREFT
jgi:transcriptional regulator with XRE-family HTH domain